MQGELSVLRMESSDSMARSSGAEGEAMEVDFTAKRRSSSRFMARETLAKEPWPSGEPRIHLRMGEEEEAGEDAMAAKGDRRKREGKGREGRLQHNGRNVYEEEEIGDGDLRKKQRKTSRETNRQKKRSRRTEKENWC